MTTCGKIHIQLVSCFSLFSSVAILWDLAVFTYSLKKNESDPTKNARYVELQKVEFQKSFFN